MWCFFSDLRTAHSRRRSLWCVFKDVGTGLLHCFANFNSNSTAIKNSKPPKKTDPILRNKFASSQINIFYNFQVLWLFSNLDISCETGLEKSLITREFRPLTTPGSGSRFDPPFQEAHQPDGRPAGRQRRATEKRTSVQVVLSTSPRPDSVIAGRTTDQGDSRGRTRSLEIDARRCKPHQATRLERASAQEGRKIGKGLNLGFGLGVGSGRKEDRKGLHPRLRFRIRLRKEGRSERASS